jgi:hypothetical protein
MQGNLISTTKSCLLEASAMRIRTSVPFLKSALNVQVDPVDRISALLRTAYKDVFAQHK